MISKSYNERNERIYQDLLEQDQDVEFDFMLDM